MMAPHVRVPGPRIPLAAWPGAGEGIGAMTSAVRFVRFQSLSSTVAVQRTDFALVGTLYLMAYLTVDFFSYIRWFGDSGLAPWNPAIGMTVALLIRRGWIYGLWLFPAVICSEVLVRHEIDGWMAQVAVAGSVTAIYMIALMLLQRVWRADPRLERLRDLLSLLITALGATAAVSFTEAGILLFSRQLGADAFWPGVFRVWVGDMIGIAVITPLILRLVNSLGADRNPEREAIPAEAAFIAIALLIGACTWIVFGLDSTDEFKWFYLFFLPVVAAALRYGLTGACMALAIAQLAVILIMQWKNYPATSLTEFQLLMLVLTTTGLLAGVVVSERFKAEAAFRRSEMRLREQQAELVNVSRLKLLGEMGVAVAHEVGQPITAARAYVRAGERLAASGGDAVLPATDAMRQAIIQLDLAGSILGRIRGLLSKGRQHSEAIDLRVAIEEAVALARFEATRAGVKIVTDFGAVPAIVTADQIQVEQVLLNLFRNSFDALAAVPSSRRAVHVTVEMMADGGEVHVGVRDNGPGIPPDIAESLFKPFNSTKPEGLGLGLTISRTLVESWGGRLWLADTGAMGTEFRLSWPKDAVAEIQPA
jgi:signal transduction histidine kinase